MAGIHWHNVTFIPMLLGLHRSQCSFTNNSAGITDQFNIAAMGNEYLFFGIVHPSHHYGAFW